MVKFFNPKSWISLQNIVQFIFPDAVNLSVVKIVLFFYENVLSIGYFWVLEN